MAKYVCSVCGYVYDPAVGDPDNGVKAGTSFEFELQLAWSALTPSRYPNACARSAMRSSTASMPTE